MHRPLVNGETPHTFDVLDLIRQCNIRNCSIYLKNGLLLCDFECHRSDFAAELAGMAADKTTQV
jgi:L-rhamnose mutarotase